MPPRRFLCPECKTGIYENPFLLCSAGCAPHRTFKQNGCDAIEAEFARSVAKAVGTELWRFALEEAESYIAATGFGITSGKVQAQIEILLQDLGFLKDVGVRVAEAGFQPDFLHVERKVLVEVERGKTIDNNMDMLDFWKCHIHESAAHLILVVPVWYQISKSLQATFPRVCRRLEPMFEPRNYTNVRSLNIVGY